MRTLAIRPWTRWMAGWTLSLVTVACGHSVLRCSAGTNQPPPFLPGAIIPGSTEPVLNRLNALRVSSTIDLAEEECAVLLQKYTNSPQVSGRIHATMVERYAHEGYREFERTVHHCELALACPLRVEDACRVLSHMGNALSVRERSAGVREVDSFRKQALDAYLTGLRVCLTKVTSLEKLPVPVVGAFSIMGDQNDPAFIAAKRKNEAEWRARDEIIAANKLVDWKHRFKRSIVGLYHGVPYSEEVKEEGDKLIPGSPIIQEMLDEIKKENQPETASPALPKVNERTAQPC